MQTGLGPDQLGDLLDQPLLAVLATRRRDETVMLSPVWFEWVDGGINIWVPADSAGKVAHIERDPRVSVVIFNHDWPYKGFEVRGDATLDRTPDSFYAVLRRTATRYEGVEEAERMVSTYPPGVVVRIEPGATRGWDYADAD